MVSHTPAERGQFLDFDRNNDANLRQATFNWLKQEASLHEDVLPRNSLANGFDCSGQRISLVGPQGLFKPAIVQAPLSITTSPKGPYGDHFGPDGILRYSHRGNNPEHPDNRGLRFAMLNNLPLVYFHGIIPGLYMALWPVYVVGDNPESVTFTAALDDMVSSRDLEVFADSGEEQVQLRRQYVTTQARHRLHQRAFRERVLQAYRNQCALCRRRHVELLDAAHIIPDAEELGEPAVPNGISLCRLHHAAFDRFFLTIRPDFIIEVRADILREEDGPTLRHAIQGIHGQHIVLPARKALYPAASHLGQRYARFAEMAEIASLN